MRMRPCRTTAWTPGRILVSVAHVASASMEAQRVTVPTYSFAAVWGAFNINPKDRNSQQAGKHSLPCGTMGTKRGGGIPGSCQETLNKLNIAWNGSPSSNANQKKPATEGYRSPLPLPGITPADEIGLDAAEFQEDITLSDASSGDQVARREIAEVLQMPDQDESDMPQPVRVPLIRGRSPADLVQAVARVARAEPPKPSTLAALAGLVSDIAGAAAGPTYRTTNWPKPTTTMVPYPTPEQIDTAIDSKLVWMKTASVIQGITMQHAGNAAPPMPSPTKFSTVAAVSDSQ